MKVIVSNSAYLELGDEVKFQGKMYHVTDLDYVKDLITLRDDKIATVTLSMSKYHVIDSSNN